MPIRPFDAEEFTAQCCLWIRDRVKEAKADKIVLGLSGGIDSAVVAHLCAKVVGRGDLILVWLGCGSTNEEYYDAEAVANGLGIDLNNVELAGAYDLLCASSPCELSKLGKANTKSRLRMVTLYAIANSVNGIVAGTGDKSEDDVGYFTKYGDGGVDFSPLADIYKSEVRELGRYLGVPEHVITKPSSPGLWAGQTAEGELGMSYDTIEAVLEGIEINEDNIQRVMSLHASSAHKRAYPPVFQWDSAVYKGAGI